MKLDLEVIRARLEGFAAAMGVEPPATLVSPNQCRSREVNDFCDKHGVSPDWVYEGQGQVFRSNGASNAEVYAYVERQILLAQVLAEMLEEILIAEQKGPVRGDKTGALAMAVKDGIERAQCLFEGHYHPAGS